MPGLIKEWALAGRNSRNPESTQKRSTPILPKTTPVVRKGCPLISRKCPELGESVPIRPKSHRTRSRQPGRRFTRVSGNFLWC